MRAADYLIDCGPGAGQLGGKIVAQGTPEQVAQADTLTARWLRGPLGRKAGAALPPGANGVDDDPGSAGQQPEG